MELESAKRAVVRMALAFLVGDLLLFLFLFFHQPIDMTLTSILIGMLVGQFGLGCAAVLRHETLRDGAVCWLFLLVTGVAIIPVFFKQAHNAGYVLIFALILAGISLATNLLPCVVCRWIGAKPAYQFSILHIMLVTTLVGVGIMIAMFTPLFIPAAIGFVLLCLTPSAVGCLLVGLLSQKRAFLGAMAMVAALVGTVWVTMPQGWPVCLNVLAQTVTVALGGYVLMLVPLESMSHAEFNSATTKSPLPSEPAPGPFDEP